MLRKTLAHYEILDRIGEGGMGEVWRANDTSLGRQAAIKILPQAFASDPERMARFEREARTLAALNHRHIAGVYGFHEVDGVRFIAMEYVPGEDLAARLSRGAIPLEDALPMALQLAEALEYAHERGVVHRDLKPANIKLLPDGSVKILDFGLARALETPASGGSQAAPSLSASPTITSPATAVGVILGTAAYMSPEQARGKVVDRRADIWAFGVVLFEMLTGRQLFTGETITDVLAAVVREEPDFKLLPAGTPARLRNLLERCLRKDPSRRLRDIGDARVELAEILADPSAMRGEGAAGARQRAPAWRGSPAVAWGLIAILGLGLVAALIKLRTATRPSPAIVTHLALPVTEVGLAMEGEAVPSPDGGRLALILGQDESTQLYVRELDRPEPTLIPDTRDAWQPFFSPDGQWIAFFAEGKLRKVPAAGGPPVTLCDAYRPRGGTWGPDGTILFTPGTDEGLMKIRADGGKPEPVTKPDLAANERSHRWPAFLPGGQEALLTITYQTGDPLDDASIAMVSLKTGKITPLFKGGGFARYASTGHLLYAAHGSILAVPFDPKNPRIESPAVPVVTDVSMSRDTGAGKFAFSDHGLLAFIQGGPGVSRLGTLGWVDRTGAFTPIPVPMNPYSTPRIVPDGKRVVVEIEGAQHHIWMYDLERGTLSRVTTGEECHTPLLSPDGERVAYHSIRGGAVNLYVRSLSGAGGEEILGRTDNAQMVSSWSRDGRYVLYTPRGSGARDLYLLPLSGEDRTPRPLFETPASETGGAFSADGRYITYVSDESGREEIYVAAFPVTGLRVQISTDGGIEPRWSPDGRELFYRQGRKMMAVTIGLSPTFSASRPRELFEADYSFMSATGGPWAGIPNYDVGRDGRFLMIKAAEEPGKEKAAQVHVVLNWFEELKRKVGGGQ